MQRTSEKWEEETKKDLLKDDMGSNSLKMKKKNARDFRDLEWKLPMQRRKHKEQKVERKLREKGDEGE